MHLACISYAFGPKKIKTNKKQNHFQLNICMKKAQDINDSEKYAFGMHLDQKG